MFSLKGPKMNQKAKDYTPHFPLEHAEKDVRFAQQLGRDYDIKMGVGAAAQGRLSDIGYKLLTSFTLLLTTKTNHDYGHFRNVYNYCNWQNGISLLKS